MEYFIEMKKLLYRKDRMPTSRTRLTGHGGRLSLAPIGGEGRGEGASQLKSIVAISDGFYNAMKTLRKEFTL
jgi:hypothetical protein